MKNHPKLELATAIWLIVILMCGKAQADVSYLDNGVIKIGVDETKGGTITYLSLSSSLPSSQYGVKYGNLVNTYDLGREIQQSYYTGPNYYKPAGVEKNPSWSDMCWNPVQAGDSFNNPSQVLSLTNNGTQIYTKTVPKQWALKNYPADCLMEQWITVDGAVATVKNRLTMKRTDTTRFGPWSEELPAMYTISALDKLITYTGTQPFTGAPKTRISSYGSWRATESWAAFVDQNRWGLGIHSPGICNYAGSMGGTTGGDSDDGSFGYLSPHALEILDHNLVYDYTYNLILGSVDEIRSFAYAHKDNAPKYEFTGTRDHWTFGYNHGAYDSDVPADDHWRVQLLERRSSPDEALMLGPECAFMASDVSKIYIRARYSITGSDFGQLYWERTNGADPMSEAQSYSFSIINDGLYHTYVLDVASNPYWTGEISRLRFDPVRTAGGVMDIQYISSVPEPSTMGLLLAGGLSLAAYLRRRRLRS